MGDLFERVGQIILDERLLRRGQKVLVAVSGGVDSMVLLHILHRLAPRHGWQLIAVHFNHQLRGQAGNGDQQFVQRAARKLGMACEIGRGSVRSHARATGASLEMAARALRHRFLASAAAKAGSSTCALAHHADDQLELFFLRLLRGAGGKGLGGMSVQSPAPYDPALKLIRPLLEERKRNLIDYARTHSLAFREDASNRDDAILRNRVRRRLLPAIERHFGSEAVAPMLQSMSITAEEGAFVEDAARIWLARRNHDGFDSLPVAVQRQCLRLQLAALDVPATFESIEQLRSNPGKCVSAGAILLSRHPDSGTIAKEAPANRSHNPARMTLSVAKKGSASFDGLQLRWKPARMPRNPRRPRPEVQEEWFDAEKMGGQIVLRHWQPGDRFQPSGMARTVKLQDLFVNARIPAAERRSLAVATTAGGEVFWVERLRIGERFKLGPSTRLRLCWQWRRMSRTSGKHGLNSA